MSKFLLALLISVTLTSTSLYAMEVREDQRAPAVSKQRRPQLPTPPRGIAKLSKGNVNYFVCFLEPKSLRVVAKSSKYFLSLVTPNIKSACIGAKCSIWSPLLVSDDFLGAMTNLTYLNLASKHNNTNKALAPLKNLKILKLANGANITDISGLSSLTCLVIDRNNSITDITPLTNLKYLDLGHNEEIKDGGISCLTNLESLYLEGKTKISINGLTNLKNLTHLSLTSRDFTDEELNNLPTLKSLSIKYCHTIKGQLLKLTSLTSLSLDNNDYTLGANLRQLITLERLTVSRNTCVYDRDLETLTNLKTLVFDNKEDHITSQSISKLTNLTYLDYDSYSHLRITDEAMQRLTKLETLVVGKNGVSEDSLSKLVNLTYLDCSGDSNITTGTLMEHPSLKRVRMLGCPQIDAGELNKKEIVTLSR